MEIVSHDEVVNKYIGEKGTPKRDAFDKEVIDYANDFLIKKLFSKFDFEKVHKAMTALNWTWATCNNQVPSIEHIKQQVADSIKTLLDDKDAYSISSGGFVASKEGDDISLAFVVCYADSDETE